MNGLYDEADKMTTLIKSFFKYQKEVKINKSNYLKEIVDLINVVNKVEMENKEKDDIIESVGFEKYREKE